MGGEKRPVTPIAGGSAETASWFPLVTLFDGKRGMGVHNIEWDGRNAHQEPSSSGVYFIRILTGDYTETVKMVFIK